MTKKLNFNNELEREIKAAEKFLSLTKQELNKPSIGLI